ncbi:lysyl-tRNA synthetase [Candidatus Protochlamydia naegleriophila]|uniref:Lysine--tRNA ligase n=1 Tax=Candidatus Protochlamydia naegleriophila TaxID=389348 RepID=A0A0U5JEU1_9BACT|nr:lysine--tRNA ligase [Candidatus Protochlamydia naegleriophila]CUI16278.1 lysyl-tRNA synthetase [Candidatus Protochlamydia naegleriophila]
MTKKPDYHQHEEFQNRLRKLAEIRQANVDPYPAKYTPTHTTHQLHQEFDQAPVGHSEDAAAGSTIPVCLAGRLVLFRSMGKNAFAHLQDESGRIQIMFNRDQTVVDGYTPDSEDADLSPYKFIEKKIDLGDIIGIEGYLFHTNKGELTVFVKKVTMLCKTLLPLADKHGGLADKELRYRKRWLDLISHLDVAKLFRTRSHILKEIRSYFDNQQFLEVETPILQSIYGGAEARPFITKLNALDQEMFLRISLEIPLKKLIVGGMNRVYEMGRVFRNEGIDRNHNPEFTLLEAYASYWDYHDMMGFVEKLFEKLAIDLYGTTQVPYTPHEGAETIHVDMKAPWIRLTMKDSIKHYGKLDVDTLSDEEMRRMLEESGHCDLKKLKGLSRGLLIAALFEVLVEPHLIQPHHIYDHPIETTPLCKPHRDPKVRQEGIVERFESFILTQEVCNSYSELNDPEIQRDLLEKQSDRRDAGDEEASPLDEEFIEAICQGMPPTGGIGIGIDRLVMILTNSHSIRDVLYFPWMKNV